MSVLLVLHRIPLQFMCVPLLVSCTCPTPYVLHSFCIPSHMHLNPCVFYFVCDPIHLYSTPCISHSLGAISLPVYLIPCISMPSISHPLAVSLPCISLPCISQSLCISFPSYLTPCISQSMYILFPVNLHPCISHSLSHSLDISLPVYYMCIPLSMHIHRKVRNGTGVKVLYSWWVQSTDWRLACISGYELQGQWEGGGERQTQKDNTNG